MSKNRLTGMGECMIELSSLDGVTFKKSFAGDVMNTLYYARKALDETWSTSLYSGLGTESQSAEMVSFLNERGIETNQILEVPERSPGLYMIHLDGAERSFSYWRDTSAARLLASDKDRVRQVIGEATALYLSGITMAILPPSDAGFLIDELSKARDAGKTVAFDPNIRPRLWSDEKVMRETITNAAKAASIILPSFDDEASAFGDATPLATLERYESPNTLVVVKNGGASVVAKSDGQVIEVPTPPVAEPVDTTGAGDSFNGAFLAHYLTHQNTEEAIRSGQACAAEVICHQGAIV